MADAHFLDGVVGRLMRRPLMFADGWGDDALLHMATEPPAFGAETFLDLKWVPQGTLKNIPVAEATFESPEISTAPPVTVAVVQRWGLDESRMAAIVLAASGEAGFSRRQAIYHPLVKRGVTTFFLENPFYGRRRPPKQSGTAVRTFAEQLMMNMLTIKEACALFHTLRQTGYDPIVLTGYSMGGHMAAYAACHLNTRLGVVPCATGLSPVPIYTQDILSWSVDWNRLGSGARQRVAELFRPTVEALPPLHPQAEAILVAPKKDGFVSAAEVQRLHCHWPRSELRWCPGGHVSAYMFQRAMFRQALVDVLNRLTSPSHNLGGSMGKQT